MKSLLLAIALPLGLLLAGAGHAQAPAGAPAGTTGACKDGSYTDAASKKGACRGHKGVKEWYASGGGAAEAEAATTKASRRTSSTSTAAASAPASAAPAGSTGLCKDGSYTNADAKKGACRGHKGVKEWYGAAATAAAATTPAAAPAAPAAPPTMAPTRPAAAAPAPHAPSATDLANRAPAAGGGAGKVWVNTETKVYHCSTDRYYGKTKQGEYMSEADAVAKGNHAAHGKACGQ